MTEAGGQVALLLAQVGPHRIGLELATVLQAADTGSHLGPAAVSARDLFGLTTLASRGRQRALLLAPTRATILVVDEVLGVRTVGVQHVQPLPAVLYRAGVPAWLLGVWWEDDGPLVFLIDGIGAAQYLGGV